VATEHPVATLPLDLSEPKMNGIHEVRGSIPLSSTIQINNLENGQSGENAGLSISCPFFSDETR
jgi:hypothetical protein